MTMLERKQLIDSLLEGAISDADFLRIEAELSVDPAARKEYFERLTLSALLEAEAEAQGTVSSQAVPKPLSLGRWQWRRGAFGLAAAATLLVAVIGWIHGSSEDRTRPYASAPDALAARGEEQASGFAVVAGQNQAVWKDGPPLADGALVPSGQLRLASGVAQLELFSGVTVIVEGEARFSILSPMEVTVAQGKVRAHVPEPARGFRIHTNQGEVVDLGTDFALDVSAEHSEIHVLEGEVEWHPRASGMTKMSRGEAARWSHGKRVADLVADATGFVGPSELQRQLASTRQARRERWIKFNEALRHDPRLVALYQLGASEDWSRQLPNRALAGEAGAGAIVAAARSADRWGEPLGALDFSPTGSRARVFIPGECRSLTLLCWVKINSLDRWYNSLFLTDGHDLHEPHWQIMDDGRLFFSVKKRNSWDPSKGEKDKHIFYSPPFWDNAMSGRWLMLATVYDPDARLVTHYLNGEPISQETIPPEYLVEQISIGNASLGNWGLPERDDPRFAVRNLNGSIDEFALFKAALTPREIKEFHENGKP